MSESVAKESMLTKARDYGPGVLMSFTIAAAATFVSEHYGAPAMLFALLIGMAFHFLSVEGQCVSGVKFTSTRLLKIGVALLGVRVTFSDIASLGAAPVILTPILIILTIGAGFVFAKLAKRDRKFGILTGGAVAICGASAALAIYSALGEDKDTERDTLFTVIAVTSLSTVAMILYPILFTAFGFDDRAIGYLLGATIHDVAQVVGAGYAVSDEAGAVATYVKLLRVACLPVVVIIIAFASRRAAQAEGGASAPFPWFALGFAALLVVNSIGLIPPVVASAVSEVSRWLLVAAIAALGMKTSLKAIADLGPRHIGVVVAETVFLCIAGVVAAFAMGPL